MQGIFTESLPAQQNATVHTPMSFSVRPVSESHAPCHPASTRISRTLCAATAFKSPGCGWHRTRVDSTTVDNVGRTNSRARCRAASATTTNEDDALNAFESTPRASVVLTRVATTSAHVDALARVCGDAFAHETSASRGRDEKEVRATADDAAVWFERSSADADGLEGVVGRVREVLDASYANSIRKELTHLTKHQIEEKRKASKERRMMKTRGIENATTARLREKSQCLTLVSRFASSKEKGGEDKDSVRLAGDSWVGSASLRVCSPEALLPEPFPTSKPRVPYVSNVAVRADARGRGVASAMLLKCERASRLWGYDHLWLHVDRDNPNARAMYERRGYIAVGEDPWWYGLGGLLGKRRILLKKRLPSSSSS